MNPNDIYAHFLEKYLACSSYIDAGQIMEYRAGENNPAALEMTFRTVFERPLKLKFEWTKSKYPTKNARYVLVSDGDQTWEHYSFHDEPQICQSLSSALGGAAGISKGEVRIIPALITNVLASRLHPKILQNLRLTQLESIGNHECYRVVASALKEDDTSLWFSTHDFSLRRHRSRHSNYLSETTYTEVEINVTVPAGTFTPERN